MTTIKRSFQLSPTKAATVLARLDKLNKPKAPTPPSRHESRAGWDWSEGEDPYLQTES